MIAKLSLYGFLVINLASCHKYSNKINDAILSCGVDNQPEALLVPVTGPEGVPSVSTLEAMYMNDDGSEEPVPISPKSCVRISKDETRTLLIRTRVGQNLAALYNPAERSRFIALEDVSTQNPFIECPQDVYLNRDFLEIGPFVKGSYTSAALRLESQVSGRGFQLIRHNSVRGWLADLRAEPEGGQSIVLKLTNLFRSSGQSIEKTCTVFVDRQKPKPMMRYAADFPLDDKNRVFTRNPGESISFEMDNEGAPQQLFYCLKSLKNAEEKVPCQSQDFLPARGAVIAPDFGLWSISFFAEDAAGNRSEMETDRFLVYHQAEVDAISNLIKLARSEFVQDRQFHGMTQLLQAAQKKEKLSVWEQRAFSYPLLQGFLDKLPRVRQLATFPLPLPEKDIRVLEYFPDGKGWVVGGHSSIQILDMQGRLVRELEGFDTPISTIKFSPSGKFLLIKAGEKWAFSSVDGKSSCTLIAEPRVTLNPANGHDELSLRDDGNRILKLMDDRCESLGQIPYPADPKIISISISPDRKMIATTSETGMDGLFVILTHNLYAADDLNHPVRTAVTKPFISDIYVDPVFHSDGTWVVYCNPDVVAAMNLVDGSRDFQTVTQSRMSPSFCRYLDDSTLYLGNKQSQQIISLFNGRLLLEMPGDRQRSFNSMAQNSFEMREYDSTFEVSITPWFAKEPDKVFRLVFGDDEHPVFAFHPLASQQFATLTKEGVLTIWEPETNVLTQAPDQQPVFGLPIVSRNSGAYLSWRPDQKRFDVWNKDHGFQRSLAYKDNIMASLFFRLDPQGRYFLVGRPTGTVHIWSLDGTIDKIISLPKARSYVNMEFSQDGQFLFALDDEHKSVVTVRMDGFFSFTSSPFEVQTKFVYPLNAHDRALQQTTAEGGTSVQIFDEVGNRLKEFVFANLYAYEPAFSASQWAIVDEQGHVRAYDGLSYVATDYGAVPRRQKGCKLSFVGADVFVLCASGDISRHQADGTVTAFQVSFAVDALQQDAEGNYWVTALQQQKAELRSPEGMLLLTLSHPSKAPGEMRLMGPHLYFANWLDYKNEIHVLPQSLPEAMKRACLWARDYLVTHQQEFPGVSTYCDGIALRKD